MEVRNTKRGQIHIWNDLTYFWYLNWGDSTISMYSGKTPSSMEWLLNPVNKGKYKRNVFVSYLLLSFLLYNSFWDFLGQGIAPTNQRGGKINNQNMEFFVIVVCVQNFIWNRPISEWIVCNVYFATPDAAAAVWKKKTVYLFDFT